MIQKTEAICIKNTRYGESSVISKMYSLEHGLSAYIIQGINRKSSQIRPSHICPGNIIEIVFYQKAQASVHRIKELRVSETLNQLQTNMSKNLVLQFILEIIVKTNEENFKDEIIFNFLKQTLKELDATEQVGYFPLFFLCNYLKFSGWFPNLGIWEDGNVFNLQEGKFESQESSNFVSELLPKQSKYLFHILQSLQKSEIPEIIETGNKKAIFNTLLLYYEIHILKGKKIKSPAILAELLA